MARRWDKFEAYGSWVATIEDPAFWLTSVAAVEGFTPRKDPMAMGMGEIQQAIANVLCPPRLASSVGVGVSFGESTDWRWGLGYRSIVVFRCQPAATYYQIARLFHGAELVPAIGDATSLRRLLETGGQRTHSLCRHLYQGLPIRGN